MTQGGFHRHHIELAERGGAQPDKQGCKYQGDKRMQLKYRSRYYDQYDGYDQQQNHHDTHRITLLMKLVYNGRFVQAIPMFCDVQRLKARVFTPHYFRSCAKKQTRISAYP